MAKILEYEYKNAPIFIFIFIGQPYRQHCGAGDSLLLFTQLYTKVTTWNRGFKRGYERFKRRYEREDQRFEVGRTISKSKG
jgi:hypothetical protein